METSEAQQYRRIQSSKPFIFIFGFLISNLNLNSMYLITQSPEWKEINISCVKVISHLWRR